MAERAARRTGPRTPLSRDRVIQAAIELADREGVEALTMRRLGQELGVEAMSLYNHVADKDDILEAVVDTLVSGIARVPTGSDWRATMLARGHAARDVMRGHPWLPKLITTRSAASFAILGYLDEVVAILQDAGFSPQLLHDSMHVLGSRILGFTMDLLDPKELVPKVDELLRRSPRDILPHMGTAFQGVRHDEEVEFEFGLTLVLEGIERRRLAEASTT